MGFYVNKSLLRSLCRFEQRNRWHVNRLSINTWNMLRNDCLVRIRATLSKYTARENIKKARATGESRPCSNFRWGQCLKSYSISCFIGAEYQILVLVAKWTLLRSSARETVYCDMRRSRCTKSFDLSAKNLSYVQWCFTP